MKSWVSYNNMCTEPFNISNEPMHPGLYHIFADVYKLPSSETPDVRIKYMELNKWMEAS